jgi:hypothetical protein
MHLSVYLILSSLIAKTWRVQQVLLSGLKRVSVQEKVVVRMVLLALVVLIAYLLFVVFYGNPHTGSSVEEMGRLQSVVHKYCKFTHSETTIPLYCLEVLALIYGYYLCWATKDVPDGVNDSRSIAIGKSLCYFYPLYLITVPLQRCILSYSWRSR